jgi:DNA-binding transcriptional MerR regulator
MTPKLYKAADVCRMADLPHYVLQSWEREFPGIGIQKSADSPRLYRQSDVDQVQRIKQLVIVEGLTLSGARRKLEDLAPVRVTAADVSEVIEVIGADAQKRIARVRDGLRSILHLLNEGGGRSDLRDGVQYELTAPREPVRARKAPPARSKPSASARKVVAARSKTSAKRASRAR